MQHVLRIPNGILHYSSTDAKFRLPDGRPVYMEFHQYCGPMFMHKGDEIEYCPTDENDPIWDQFEGWWEAKGKHIYVK